jgi:hypothetical protein
MSQSASHLVEIRKKASYGGGVPYIDSTLIYGGSNYFVDSSKERVKKELAHYESVDAVEYLNKKKADQPVLNHPNIKQKEHPNRPFNSPQSDMAEGETGIQKQVGVKPKIVPSQMKNGK